MKGIRLWGEEDRIKLEEIGGIFVSGTRLRNEFLPGQESRDPSEGGVPSPNESGVRPNIQMATGMESLPQTFARPNSVGMFGGEFQSEIVRPAGEAKITEQRGGKKDEEIMKF